MIGTVVGGQRVVAKLGEGGMGIVFRAEDTVLGRPTVVKVLRPQLSRNTEIVRRFFNEAKAASSIGHPGIVQIHAFGFHEDQAYITMEMLDGESLQDRLTRLGRLPVAEAVRIGRQVASALMAAHALAIVHRDLKPDNLFLVPDAGVEGGERVKLLDFGIAKLASPAEGGGTRVGDIFGTPAYMSPEQCLGEHIDARTDLYALGCILFQMVCGRLPFVADSANELLAAQLRDEPPRPADLCPGLDPAVATVIERLLAKRPEDRLPSAESVRNALTSSATPRADARDRRRRPVVPLLIGVGIVGIGVATAVVLTSGGGGASTDPGSAASASVAGSEAPRAADDAGVELVLRPLDPDAGYQPREVRIETGTSRGDEAADGRTEVRLALSSPIGDLGKLTPEEIDRVIRTRQGVVKACYHRELLKHPKLHGKLVVGFRIDADGKVVNVNTVEDTLDSDPVADCVKRQVMKMVFPAKGPASVKYPFLFSHG